jgi:hypothetical protein
MLEGAVSESNFRLYTLAWSLLENSFRLAPEIPSGLKWRSCPRLLIWDDAEGWCDFQPRTLTVYEPWTPETGHQRVVRYAEWDRNSDFDALRRQPVSVNPTISVRDSKVPDEPFNRILRNLAGCRLCPANLVDDGGDTDDVGSTGFEYFSKDYPASRCRLQWAEEEYPADWKPIVELIDEMKHFLLSCVDEAGR